MNLRRRRHSLLCLAVAIALVICVVPQETAAEGEGAVSAALQDAAEAGEGLPRLRSLLVSHRGTLVLERYYHGAKATTPANVKSVSKSLISALVGIAVARGTLAGIEQPIGGFFPRVLRQDDERRAITIEDLLTMRAGLEPTSSRNYGAWVRSPDWVRYVLNRPLIATPGERMAYSTGNTHVLSAILTQATRASTWQFANDVLARPLGFTLARWPRDPQGVYFGGNEMLMTPLQMVAFGELYLNRGRAAGRQVVPAEWVESSIVPRTRSPRSEQQYGYGWWIRELAGRQTFYAWGFGGQFIIVVPSLELVVVSTSLPTVSDDRRTHRTTVLDLIERLIIERLGTAEESDASQ